MLESFESTTSFRAYCDNTLEISFSPSEEIWIPESRKLLPVESGIQKCFLVNPESWLSVESEIQLKESGIPLTIGIRNPSSTDKNPESSPWSPESVAWNRQSKTFLDSLIWQSDLILSVVYSRLQDKKYGREVFFMKKGNRFKLTIGQIRKGDIYVYFDNSRSLVFWFLVDNDLIHPYDEWDAFFHCRI